MRQWVRQWSLGQRIAGVGCILTLPVVLALFFITQGFSEDITFAELELSGNEYQRPLEKLLEVIPQHKLLARRYLNGEKELQGQIGTVQGQIDAAMQALRAVDSRVGAQLQFTTDGLNKRKRDHNRFETLAQEWQELKSRLSSLEIGRSDEAHAHLIADVRTMITHVGDTSNLILDPNLDSYYLMDATLLALPQTQDRLTSILTLGQDLLAGNDAGGNGRVRLAVAAALLKESDVDRIASDVQTSLNEDQNSYGISRSLQQNLPPAARDYAEANHALLALIGKILDAPEAAVSAAEFTSAVSRARAASFGLWHTSVEELDALLRMRIDHLAKLRFWAIILTSLAVTISSAIAIGVVRSATKFLKSAAEQLRVQADEVAAASNHVSSSSQSLSHGASEQAASLEETSASSEEINSMARRNTENSHQAAGLVHRSQTKVGEANHALEEMVAAMAEITAQSDRISKIIKTIDEIAFQTNILALNAAVEAARAGEAGMGFAVVADEVRDLAHRSALAAKDTASLIAESIAKSHAGKAKVDHVASVIGAITEEAGRIKTLMDEVNLGSQEQARAIEQISQALTQMEQVTQKNAANAAESSSAAEQLSAQSATLKTIAARLTVIVGGR